MLIGSSEVAVCAHAQYKFGQKQPRTTDAHVAMNSQKDAIAAFSSIVGDAVRPGRPGVN